MRSFILLPVLFMGWAAAAQPGGFGGGSTGGGGASGTWDVGVREPRCDGHTAGYKEDVACSGYSGTASLAVAHASMCQRQCKVEKDKAYWFWAVIDCEDGYELKGGKCVQKQVVFPAPKPRAQSPKDIKIFGKVFVKDESKTGYEPALGAAVRVMSPSKGMVVDAQGAFEFMLPSVNTEVVVSYVGQKEQHVPAAQCVNGCEIRLVEDPTVLDEVVVVGCGPDVRQNLAKWENACSQNEGIANAVRRLREYCDSPQNSDADFDVEYSKLLAVTPSGCTQPEQVISAGPVARLQAVPQSAQATQMSQIRIKKIYSQLNDLSQSLGSSVWKTKEGNFNGARLASDSIAGVVLGTAGGLITSNVIKKNQLSGGFDEIHCSVGGQIVADYGDDFMVGMQ